MCAPPAHIQVDLDLGNYERFMDITLAKDNNITTGKIYQVRVVENFPFLVSRVSFFKDKNITRSKI